MTTARARKPQFQTLHPAKMEGPFVSQESRRGLRPTQRPALSSSHSDQEPGRTHKQEPLRSDPWDRVGSSSGPGRAGHDGVAGSGEMTGSGRRPSSCPGRESVPGPRSRPRRSDHPGGRRPGGEGELVEPQETWPVALAWPELRGRGADGMTEIAWTSRPSVPRRPRGHGRLHGRRSSFGAQSPFPGRPGMCF